MPSFCRSAAGCPRLWDASTGQILAVQLLKARGAHVIATTHYSGLKMYAGNEEGVVNASVEFDEKTLRPTYRLLVGVAGASSGLEIARRFGVPGPIVDDAIAKLCTVVLLFQMVSSPQYGDAAAGG